MIAQKGIDKVIKFVEVKNERNKKTTRAQHIQEGFHCRVYNNEGLDGITCREEGTPYSEESQRKRLPL